MLRKPQSRDALLAAVLALRAWTPRQHLAAAGFGVAFALLIGVPTVLIPNPVFGREIPVVAWNYPVWLIGSSLAGLLAATYLRSPGAAPAPGVSGEVGADGEDARPGRLGMLGGVLTWFAVGCPVCNKLALLVLGYSGAITWFAPFQPLLALMALVLTAGALVVRLRGQVACPVSSQGVVDPT